MSFRTLVQQPTVAGKLTTRRSLHASGVAIISLAFLAFLPNVARAAFEVKPGSFRVGFSNYQAGAHADVTESFAFAQSGADGPVGAALRNAEVVFPVGFAGYPPAVKTCTPVQLRVLNCPSGSQIGTLEAVLREGCARTSLRDDPHRAVQHGAVAERDGGVWLREPTLSVARSLRLSVLTTGCTRVRRTWSLGLELVRQSITVWGVPADPSHNALRKFSMHKIRQRTRSRSNLDSRWCSSERKPGAVPGEPDAVHKRTGGGGTRWRRIVGGRKSRKRAREGRTVHRLPVAEVPADDRGHPRRNHRRRRRRATRSTCGSRRAKARKASPRRT